MNLGRSPRSVVVGFVGAGFIARTHAKLLGDVQQSRLGYVFDLDAARMERFSRDFGTRGCSSQDELIAKSDVIYVCTWTAQHLETVKAAALAKKPVFCEKPLSTNLTDVISMVNVVQEAEIINQVGLVLRFSPAFYMVRQLISDASVGQLLSFTFRSDQYLPIDGGYESRWRLDPTQAGSGVLLEHSIHDIDMIEYLAGPIRSVSCTTQTRHGFKGVEDIAIAQFKLASGVIANLVTVWHDIGERADARRVELLSDRQWCVLDGHYHFGPVIWERAGFDTQSVAQAELLSMATSKGLTTDNEDASFIEAVLNEHPATPDFRVGLRAHTIIDGAYRSASADGTAIDIPTPDGIWSHVVS
ncbi:MAG: Gfo/Idh/MocA family oxidoreductase [Actinobacteria bacterium]|nr:Gfo/Idh/MocA family oxidoreductase [Actinomycetota bacterium]